MLRITLAGKGSPIPFIRGEEPVDNGRDYHGTRISDSRGTLGFWNDKNHMAALTTGAGGVITIVARKARVAFGVLDLQGFETLANRPWCS